ncbi:hypothetical protein CDN99_05110 [Roseateles aquatilis]|uniref:Uncharacterized protein n=1 Tax=Roseateles aquatilis TaxID=431061 RepID=A0A246JMF2_9BURK|nr:hypothetical protein [Roseateles aquatilis]OWQ93816.1 hypothetical protein CDN99_05110 [Roseateles aquatilis]
MIANAALREAFLDDPMQHYFACKLAGVEAHERLARIEETLKFLFIASECTGSIPVTKEIDEVWHLWILQTREYMALCGRLPSAAYIHHSSNDYLRWSDPFVGESQPLREDVRMLALYVRNFGPFREDRVRYWLLPSHLVGRRGWSVATLNEWLVLGAFDCVTDRGATAAPHTPEVAIV